MNDKQTEWKRRNLELEQQVAEKTADLLTKNRELEIEASLQRVRARTMAMHSSDEMNDVVHKLFTEFQQLGIAALATDIIIFNKDGNTANIWISGSDGTEGTYLTRALDHPHQLGTVEAWKNNQPFRVTELKDEYFKSFFELAFNETEGIKTVSEDTKNRIFDLGRLFHTEAFTRHGCIRIASLEKLTDISEYTLQRFAKVFEQTYTRFLDLQKAEAQARKAEIEASLERVRAKAMAMHSSKDIESATAVVFNELNRLGIDMERCGIALINETPIAEIWSTPLSQENKEVVNIITGFLDFRIHPILQQSYQDWREKKDFSTYKLVGDEVRNYYAKLEKQPEYKFPKVANYPDQQVLHSFYFKEGVIFAFTVDELSAEVKDIIQKFTKVFAQTYTRFLDIQKAEAQAIEATKQASLDRVRGEIASMRSAKDLEIITPLVWNELNTLGIPFIRCGIFIVHEEEEEAEVYLSKPDGTSLAVMHLSFGSSDLVTQIVDAWRNGNVYTQYWTQEEFLDWGRSMVVLGQVRDLESYQGAEAPPESLYLHFIPFGMLYVGSTNPLSNEEIDLAASLAEAFSIAYARYEDFVQLEKAKAGIEDALTELKATQSQLVQQEKLASLGQLTAGIAHEIKNPLNFVTNFSEVSLELIEEAREEVSEKVTVDSQQLTTILDDLESNLCKIHEHGSRADGIVKSMLQHSRGGDGKMEPTPLNPLIKEYVNLAFHGMRAGRNPINVDIELKLDDSIGMVPLIAEDFSRVILNLCNNAFDAMRDKALSPIPSPSGRGVPEGRGEGEYSPKLTVRTKSGNGKLTIEIEDNGSGIPEEMKDKILQPFFTTKKGTQGTGLGLSITNDIVKAHGGTMDVYSQPGQTVFTIKITL